MPTVADVAAYLDRFAPPSTAAGWDNVGLLVGDPADRVERIRTCLTVTPAVVAEALEQGVGLLVTHHPMLFKGVKSVTAGTAEGAMLLALIRHRVAVYSPHTAFDNCDGGINDGLAAMLGLTAVRPLRPAEPAAGPPTFKLVTFVPEPDADALAGALFAAGAGVIGNYTGCSFRTAGVGTFTGNADANPAVGQRLRPETVAETRLEVVVPAAKLDAVIRALRAAHRYEEPAFDVVPLHAPPAAGPVRGEGRVGELPAPEPLGDLARRVKVGLNADTVQVVGDPARPVTRIALACGAAGEYLADAERERADVFLTGEMRFHDLLRAESAGIALILPGHYATERPGVEALAARLAVAFPACDVAAAREHDPLRGM